MATWNNSDHACLTFGRRTVVLCRPHTGAYGYGHLLEGIVAAVLLARRRGASLQFVPTGTDVDAITRLDSDQVSVEPLAPVAAVAWRARAARRWWRAGAWRPAALAWRVVEAAARASIDATRPKPVRERRKQVVRLARARFATLLERGKHAVRDAAAPDMPRLGPREWQELAERPLDLRLSAPAALEARQLAEAAGIPIGARLVGLHVRHAHYRQTLGLEERRVDAVRGADIATYDPAIDLLVRRGFVVVRLGDPSMPPLRRQGVVDVAHARRPSKLLDVWVALESELLILCDSGPALLGRLAAVPTLAVNTVDLPTAAIKPGDRFISKSVIDEHGRRLTLVEMIERGVLRSTDRAATPRRAARLNADAFRYVDNTPEEIAGAVEEMLDVLRTGSHPTPAQSRCAAMLWASAPGAGRGYPCASFIADPVAARA